MATVKSAWFKHSLAPQFTLSQQTKHTLSILFNSYDHLLLRCCLSLNPFCYIIALFISCLYCCTCIGVLSNVLILESHRHKFKNQRLSAFCWDRITPFHSTELSLKYLIMKSRRYKNWTYTLILNKSYFFLLAFLPTMPCSLFLPLSISLSLTLSSPLLSSFNSIASFHCPAHVLNLPDENRSHCSTTIEWLMQERWTLMDFFFNVLKIEYKAWPPDVVDPFQQQIYCL